MTALNTPLRRLSLLLGVLALVLVLQAKPAAAAECLDRFGIPRTCTFFEEAGECFWSADDSYYQCAIGKPWYTSWICLLAWDVDYIACGFESLKDLLWE